MIRNNYRIYREITLQLLGNECKDCGKKEDLGINHMDSNFNNNNLENIELLCRECHIRKHTKEINEFYNSNDKGELIWKCPICYKIIKSKTESKSQFDYNKNLHIGSHKRSLNTSRGGGSSKEDLLLGNAINLDDMPTKKVDKEGNVK